MKRSIQTHANLALSALVCIVTALPLAAHAQQNFGGATPDPIGKIKQPTSQLQIRFPKQIAKNGLKGEPFKVTCTPAMGGFGSWADNDTLWTYNFKGATDNDAPRITGGTGCDVTQTADISAVDGQAWPSGQINYSVLFPGPNVTAIYPAPGFNNLLRETDPVIMLTFDGAVDRDKFFADQAGILGYNGGSSPAEKIPLAAVPADQQEAIFALFNNAQDSGVSYKDQNWILATVKPSLIPGAQMTLTVVGATSLYNPQIHSEKKITKDFAVRSQFKAEIVCANPSAKDGSCLPKSAISVNFNGHVKWSDISQATIEYTPFKSKKTVTIHPDLSNDQVNGFWNTFFNIVGHYFPYFARFNSTVVDSIIFDINAEPLSQARVTIPAGLKDVDDRLLSAASVELNVRIGAMTEVIRVPQKMSFFEKNIPNLYLPVGVVNQNQKVTIRKTGNDAKNWSPVRDVATMIKMIRGYEERGDFRDTVDYTSPLKSLGIASSASEMQLTGKKNRVDILQFPFGRGNASGLYAFEISSPGFEADQSSPKDKQYFNPKYVLSQVTNLAVQLKRGKTQTLAWVTRLSDAAPVAGASIEIYNCLGERKGSLVTNASGIATFNNQQWASDCQAPENTYSDYEKPTEFYVAARSGDDVALTHSSWLSSNSYAMGAPGIEYFYSEISENVPYVHAVLGVNLVKPGQTVPVELIARIPKRIGFADVAATNLPKSARIQSNEDENTYFDFPLSWKNGEAQLTWQVPTGEAAKIGTYTIMFNDTSNSGSNNGTQNAPQIASNEIEVAEFKVPLMTGIIAFPNQELVQPASIPVNGVLRFANGVGSKNTAVDVSYYFEPTSIESKDLPDLSFGSGPVKLTEDDGSSSMKGLPDSTRPATLQGMKTGPDGSISVDIAAQTSADGRSIAEVLKGADRPQRLVVRLRYQDQMGEYQTLSQSKVVYNAAQYVGTSLVSGTRQTAKLRVASQLVSGKTDASLSDLELKVVLIDTKVIGEELFGGLIKNTVEREMKSVNWKANCRADGKASACAIGNLPPGMYGLQATSKSTHLAASTIFKIDADGTVYGQAGMTESDADLSKQLALTLNKASYKAGERAVVRFTAPFKTCTTLVTYERSDVLSSKVVTDACGRGQVDVPVSAELAPNAFVSVYAVTGRAMTGQLKLGERDLGRPTYKLGFTNVKVDWSKYQSKVIVKTGKKSYKPGEMVDVTVNVQPIEGRLAGGTVTLVAIEEKILELKPNATYDILTSLMQQRRQEVTMVTPLEKIETVTAGNADLPDKAARKGGDDGGDGSSKSDFNRKLFDALVAFQPGLPVVNGVVKTSFKANDSLTKFKIFVIANDSSQKFGSGGVEYLVEQDTQSFSNIPSVAHTGDQFPVRVTIQNNGAKSVSYRTDVTVTVKDANGNVLSTSTLSKTSAIGKASSQAVDVGQISIDEKAATIDYGVKIYDESGKLVDAMTPPSQVILPAVPLAIHDSFLVQLSNGSASQPLSKEPTALVDKGEIRTSLSSSLVGSALKVIKGRLDQDAFADFFIESRIYKAMLMSSETNPDALKKVLETIPAYMDQSGYVKYYPQAQKGSVWLTGTIIATLANEPWAMKLLPPSLETRLKTGISAVLQKSVDPDYVGKTPMDWMRAQSLMARAAMAFNDQALQAQARTVEAGLVSALAADPAAFGDTIDTWSNHDLNGFFLMQARIEGAPAAKSAVFKELVRAGRLVYAGNSAALSGQPIFATWYTDETIETASLLLGHASLAGDKEMARSLAVGLVNAGAKGWYNTSTIVNVAESLKAFGAAYESAQVSGVSTIAIPELKKTATVDWSKNSVVEFKTPWPTATATVQVAHNGQGQPWLGVQALSAVPLTASRAQGLSIDKSIRNVTRDSGYQAGDIIEVTLKLSSAGALSHIAMRDPIPAGSNIVGDAYGDFSNGEKTYAGYSLYFAEVGPGSTTVKYQYQLNNPGTFKLPPTRAEGLYMPSIFGETPNAPMTIN